jgi:hypothetical protein
MDAAAGDFISVEWLHRASRVFEDLGLYPVLFSASGGGFELDNCYTMDESTKDLFLWGERIPAGGNSLIEACSRKSVDSIGLDSPRANAFARSDWNATVSASLFWGEIYLGVNEELAGDLASLVRQALEMARGLFTVRYGFAYKMPLLDEPASYAAGIRPTTLSDLRQWIRRQSDDVPPAETADQLWCQELNGQRRHLKDLFRDAYPTNILSESHVETAGLKSAGIGRLSQTTDALWLWELDPAEIGLARILLTSKRALVAQAEWHG